MESRDVATSEPDIISAKDVAMMREMQARYEREGGIYVGDPETGRIERADHPWARGEEPPLTQVSKPIIDVRRPRENGARPREHRSRSRTRPTRGSPDDSDP